MSTAGETTPTPVQLTARARPPGRPPVAPGRGGGLARELVDAAALAINVHVTRRHPVSLVHFVTRRCNARCSFCFIDFEHPSPRSLEMTATEIDRMTRTLGPRLANVNLTGGEPFLRRDLDAIAESYYANTSIRSIYITSNGSFPDRAEDFATGVSASFPDRKLIVSLSVDGFPEDHDRIRRVDGLFDRVIDTYGRLSALGHNVEANVAITVSHENHEQIDDLYEELVSRRGVRSVTAVIVRDEGVYEVPRDERAAVLASYQRLTSRLVDDLRSGRLDGYDNASLQGRLMNRKNEMLYEIIADTYLDPHFVSTCHAATLFGVIDANGDVHPCEILDRPLGNLRDHEMDFDRLWRSDATRETASWIRDSECHCSYECAWAFNILGNARYQPQLIGAALRR